MSRYSDNESRSKSLTQDSSASRKSAIRQVSEESIGSGSSLTEAPGDVPRYVNVGSRSSLNNQLLSSHASAVTLLPLNEVLGESGDMDVSFNSSHNATDAAHVGDNLVIPVATYNSVNTA